MFFCLHQFGAGVCAILFCILIIHTYQMSWILYRKADTADCMVHISFAQTNTDTHTHQNYVNENETTKPKQNIHNGWMDGWLKKWRDHKSYFNLIISFRWINKCNLSLNSSRALAFPNCRVLRCFDYIKQNKTITPKCMPNHQTVVVQLNRFKVRI